MAKVTFRELLERASRWEAMQREAYARFLRTTPDPDEPHWCWGETRCVLCELLVAKEHYDEANEESWLETDATLISYGYNRQIVIPETERPCYADLLCPWGSADKESANS